MIGKQFEIKNSKSVLFDFLLILMCTEIIHKMSIAHLKSTQDKVAKVLDSLILIQRELLELQENPKDMAFTSDIYKHLTDTNLILGKSFRSLRMHRAWIANAEFELKAEETT